MKGDKNMNIFNDFSFDRFLFSLQYMWQGMLCIFIVIGVIVISAALMNFCSAKAQARKELKESENDEN